MGLCFESIDIESDTEVAREAEDVVRVWVADTSDNDWFVENDFMLGEGLYLPRLLSKPLWSTVWLASLAPFPVWP